MGNDIYPQVLLLGNGINRAYNCNSWNDLIKEVSGKDFCESKLPMPLKIVLATDNHVESQFGKFLSDEFSNFGNRVTDPSMRTILQRILSMGFSDILTTNYSYELEVAATNQETISKWKLRNERKHTPAVQRLEKKYFLHTYHEITYKQVENKIWHIHGEILNPSSIVIGHYHYGNLFSRIREYLRLAGNKYVEEQNGVRAKHTYNWIDAFILGEIHILGFGYDVSEFDLWWLLDRKMREKAHKGKVHFYHRREKSKESDTLDKLKLLQCYDVVLHPIDESDYKNFYNRAVDVIQHQVKDNRI